MTFIQSVLRCDFWNGHTKLHVSCRSFSNNAAHRIFHSLLHRISEVVPQFIDPQFEIRNLANGMFQGFLHNWRKGEFPDNSFHCLPDYFGALRGLFSGTLSSRYQPGPVTLEDLDQRVHDIAISNNQAQLAALVEFGFPQALAAQKGFAAVTKDGSRVEPHAH